jgi:hypothetical protein
MKLYLAGPMSDLPYFNYPAFKKAAEALRALGHEVINPAELDEPDQDSVSVPWADYIRRDLRYLLECEAVAVLPGWRDSKGASLEVYVAESLGMEILDATELRSVAETVLEEADRLVMGERQSAYGHPLDDFTRTGRIWGAILGIPDVSAEKVGLCMIGVKISRETNYAKRDNRVDGPGYWQCVDLIHVERKRRSR